MGLEQEVLAHLVLHDWNHLITSEPQEIHAGFRLLKHSGCSSSSSNCQSLVPRAGRSDNIYSCWMHICRASWGTRAVGVKCMFCPFSRTIWLMRFWFIVVTCLSLQAPLRPPPRSMALAWQCYWLLHKGTNGCVIDEKQPRRCHRTSQSTASIIHRINHLAN